MVSLSLVGRVQIATGVAKGPDAAFVSMPFHTGMKNVNWYRP